METSNEIDRATIGICDGKPRLGRWSYTLETSNDDNYPCISYGQLLLRGDGVVFQRVLHSGPEEFGPWDIGPQSTRRWTRHRCRTNIQRVRRQLRRRTNRGARG